MDPALLYIIIGAITFIIAGISKGISGLGLPVVATPVLTVLFDLQTAIALVMPATVATDLFIVLRSKKEWKVVHSAFTLILFGIIGIILGSYLLVFINISILTGTLSVVILLFVITSWFNLIPNLNRRPPKWMDALIGFVGGSLQGAAGASGPFITMYLFQIKLNRNDFLFVINCFFVVIDITQLVTIYQLGFYYGEIIKYALLAFIPVTMGIFISYKIQKYTTDIVFRKTVLVLIAISGVVLAIKSII